MPERDSPYKLNLSDELRDSLELTFCRRIDDAVAGAEARNSQWRIWRDQLENLSVTAQNQLWEGACNLPDPISYINFLTVFSQITGAMHRDPKVAVEAFDADEEDNARIIEEWLSMVTSKYRLDDRLYELAYNACVDVAVVGYAGWYQKVRQRRDVGYKKKGSALVVTEDAREEGEEYEEVPLSEEVTEECYDIRAVDLNDFFLWPPTIDRVDDATAVIERFYATAEQIWDGVEDYGYDKTAVEDLTSYGPGQEDDNRVSDAEADGLSTDAGRDSLYELYVMYTRMPRRMPGDEQLPDYMMQDDYMIVCCPANNIVLKMALSPFDERPYFVGGILPKPNKILGHGLMGMLEPLQAEANANLQLSMDASNIVVSPEVIMPESMAEDIAKSKRGPGQVHFYTANVDPKQIMPWPINTSPVRDGLTWQQDIRNRAQALIGAEGQGQLQTKVRKNEEVRGVEAAASAKFGLYLTNFQRTILAEVYRRIVSLKLKFDPVDEGGEQFLDVGGQSRTLTGQALRGRYNFVATGTSLTYSPEARIQNDQQVMALQSGYITAAVQGIPAQYLKLIWHSTRQALLNMGVRNPEAVLGPEPEEEQQPAALPQPGNAAQSGNGAYPGMGLGLGANN